MPPTTPRCVYCSKPTRSHELSIPPEAYTAALEDEAIDADFGVYYAAVCHDCWEPNVPSGLAKFAMPLGDVTADLDWAARNAIGRMDHRHVRFDLS